jgi:hypothetical protein
MGQEKGEQGLAAPLTKKCIDRSGANRFSFSFFCDVCGKEWESPVVPFNLDSFASVDSEDIANLIRYGEHRTAFERANLEAVFHFNYCERTDRWMCDDCYATIVEKRFG